MDVYVLSLQFSGHTFDGEIYINTGLIYFDKLNALSNELYTSVQDIRLHESDRGVIAYRQRLNTVRRTIILI